jgi:hypothetical protein
MNTPPEQETPQQRGIRRLIKTVTLMRSGTGDADEATVYLAEEKRLKKLLARLQPANLVEVAA